MSVLEKFLQKIKQNREERKKAAEERARQDEINLQQEFVILQKEEEKHWGDQSKNCPECGEDLILLAWGSYNIPSSGLSGNAYCGNQYYTIYYTHCNQCGWQKRTFEKWETK